MPGLRRHLVSHVVNDEHGPGIRHLVVLPVMSLCKKRGNNKGGGGGIWSAEALVGTKRLMRERESRREREREREREMQRYRERDRERERERG